MTIRAATKGGLAIAALLFGMVDNVSLVSAQAGDSSDASSDASSPFSATSGQHSIPPNGVVLDETPGEVYAGSRAALMDLLSFVPNTLAAREGRPMVSYADLQAVLSASNTTMVPQATMATVQPVQLLAALQRVSVGSGDFLDLLPHLADQMPDAIGVGIGDVHRFLVFGRPPQEGMVLGLNPRHDFTPSIAATLDARGFQLSEVDSVTVWDRWSDRETGPQFLSSVNPFGIETGQAARIAYLDGALLSGPYWSLADEMLVTPGNGPSLADFSLVRAAAAAVTDPAFDGALLQFHVIRPWDAEPRPTTRTEVTFRLPLPTRWETIQEELSVPEEAGLPRYLILVIADRSTGDLEEVQVALLYYDTATAEAAAAVLAERFRHFTPPSRPDAWAALISELDATIEPHVVTFGDEVGATAAMVRISHAARLTTGEGDHGRGIRRGAIFRFIVESLWQRELKPLMVRTVD